MRCKDFLALYSDFRDGIITDPSMGLRMRKHQARCRACARHDEALEKGTEILRTVQPVEPSERFRVNLRVRMALVNRRRLDTPPVFGWPSRAAASLLIVTVIVAGFAQGRDQTTNADALPTRVVSAPPATPTPVGLNQNSEFSLPSFHQPVGNERAAAPRVTFSISNEDSGYFAVPVTASR